MQDIKIEIYNSRQASVPWPDHTDDHWGWRWKAKRGAKIVAASSELYGSRIGAVDNIALVFGVPLRALIKPRVHVIDVKVDRGAGPMLHIFTR